MKEVLPTQLEFNTIRDKLAHLASTVLDQMHALHQASFAKEASQLSSIIGKDHEIDSLEGNLSKVSMLFVEKRAPLGPDLRYIMGVIDIARSLERIGDCIEYVARHMLECVDAPTSFDNAWILLQDMVGKTTELLDRTYAAWLHDDVQSARSVPALDDAVDTLQDQAYTLVVDGVRGGKLDVELGMKLMLMVNKLESIADIGCHIAEMLVFMISAKDIRHGQQ